MILNIPVNNGGTMNSPVSQGQHEYTNFLKRKYPEHNNEQTVVTASNSLECEATNTTNSNWKKRHIDPEEATNYEGQHNSAYTSQSYKTSEPLENSEITQDVNSGTFNIIANSSFINDLFAYDANLLVPVSVNNLSDSVLTDHQQQQQQQQQQHQPIFSVPSTVEYIENEEHWQATDLLELDHRYNSTLQTEISQLNPTVNLKTTQEVNSSQQQQHTQFLLPTKPLKQQISTTTSTSNSTSLPLNSNTSAASAAATAASFASDNVEQDCDFEDKNLSWLLNFKFDEFPHLNPDVGNLNSSAKNTKIHYHTNYTNMNNTASTYPSGSSTSTVHVTPLTAAKSAQNSGQGSAVLMGESSKSPKNSNKTGKKFEELVLEATSELDGNEMAVAENVVISGDSASYRAPKKPPFTYTELIEYALEDKGELTVSGIYQWISDRFPYYKCNDDRWKNSVRHNLSINPHFRKGHKAPQGAGHLWTISSGDSAENVLAWEHKKQRLDLFFKMESINRERLQQHQQKQQQERLLQNGVGKHRHHLDCQQDQCLYDEAAVAAAAIQQEMLQQTQNNNDVSIQNQNSIEAMDTVTEHVLHDLPYNDLLTDEELRKTAGQILNGIHREVEVQSVNPAIISTYQDVLLDNDYLNPIHKDVIVNESGLRHSSHAVLATHCHSNHSSSSGPYYVTEIDPLELGIQIAHNHQHHEHQQHTHQHNQSTCDPANSVSEDSDAVLFNDEFNLNYFAYNPANDIAA